MGQEGPKEGTGKLEDYPEREPHRRRPGHPDPSARPGNLVSSAEEESLGDDSDRWREQPPKEHFLAEGAQARNDDDRERGHAASKRAQRRVQPLRPPKPVNGATSAGDDESAERKAEQGAIEVPSHRVEREPRFRMNEGRAVPPQVDDDESEDAEQGVCGSAPAKHRRDYGTRRPSTHRSLPIAGSHETFRGLGPSKTTSGVESAPGARQRRQL